MTLFRDNTLITREGYRPTVLILPFDERGRVALLGATYDNYPRAIRWGFIQGGMDEHFERARADQPLREEDFRKEAWREFTEECLIKYLPPHTCPDDLILTQFNKAIQSRGRDKFLLGKHFYVAGIRLPTQTVLRPSEDAVKGRNPIIDWVHPNGFPNRFPRRESEQNVKLVRQATEYLIAHHIPSDSRKLYKAS